MTSKEVRQRIRQTIIDMTRNQRVSDRWEPLDMTTGIEPYGDSSLLDVVREEAIKLAQAGRIALYRKKGPVVSPDELPSDYSIGNPYNGNTDDRDYNVS